MTPATRPAPFAMLASRMRADEKRLLDAFERRGLECEYVDSRASWTLLGAPRPRHQVVLNREIGHARALYAARSLESAGATVVNSAAATEVCGDKWQTSTALRAHGLPTPRTALGLTPEAALEALEVIGYPAVIKPLVGSWGRLVTLVPDRATAGTVMEYIAALPAPQSHIVYVQELVAKPDRDIRVVVVGGEVLGATYRHGDQWRTNVARGAVTEAFEPSPEMVKLSTEAAAAVGADIAGVDLIEDADGRVVVLEVNHGVEFSGFQRAVGDRVDVAGRIVEYLMARAQAWFE
uniref:LysX n=1 Tax=Streptomyces sp. SANK 60404 TaxID=1213862 RepID=A0A1B4ZDE2_9ACTN|nr:LysX [Streptomyces sp. SANK 60404]